jgi:hypothetical protein
MSVCKASQAKTQHPIWKTIREKQKENDFAKFWLGKFYSIYILIAKRLFCIKWYTCLQCDYNTGLWNAFSGSLFLTVQLIYKVILWNHNGD